MFKKDRLKLSKKKKDNNNNGSNNGKMHIKDSHENEVWLGGGGSRAMEDSFEIDP